jgi:hypothetical protein
VAEFAISIVIVALAPMSADRRNEPAARMMRQATAVIGLYFLLGLLASAGRGPAKAAVGLGGLVTLTLAVTERNVFLTIAQALGSKSGTPSGPGPTDEG